jgi:choline dehydrogenase-like flavoprotein
MRELEADLAVVGSGVSGLFASQAAVEAGLRVVMLERGALKTHAEQLADGSQSADVPGARPNNETAPGTPDYPWNYVYGVGGSSLHWDGVTPRFAPEDLNMRSAFGVMVDWPLSYEELLPFYRRAELALGVAGSPDAGRSVGEEKLLPPHPFSPMDELVADPLAPYAPLPQARPTRPVGDRPACCGSARCNLCPVDSRFSALNGLGSVLDHPGLELLTQTAAARLDPGVNGRRVQSLEAIAIGGERLRITARAYVLAAGGFENPAVLLRSGLERPAVGRYLFDHAHRTLNVRVREEVGPGRGGSLSTGASAALLNGRFRSRHSAAYVIPFNPGIPLASTVSSALVQGKSGGEVRAEALDRWRHTLPLDVLLEDVPQPARRVSLGPGKDAFGLPLVEVAYPGPTSYENEGWAATVAELERRLRPLGIREVEQLPGPAGAHLLGTCRMGTAEVGVVDGELRHLDLENLFIAGGSAMPTYSPVHPTLTISALAIRLGEALARELKRG